MYTRVPLIKRRFELASFVFASALAFAVPASADETVDVLARWGLFGVWKSDCTTPPDPSHILETYAVEGGRAVEERQGATWHDVNPVLAASLNPDGSLTIVIELSKAGNQQRVNTLVKSDLGKRTMENRRLDGSDVSVHGGVLVQSGLPTPWFHRCK